MIEGEKKKKFNQIQGDASPFSNFLVRGIAALPQHSALLPSKPALLAAATRDHPTPTSTPVKMAAASLSPHLAPAAPRPCRYSSSRRLAGALLAPRCSLPLRPYRPSLSSSRASASSSGGYPGDDARSATVDVEAGDPSSGASSPLPAASNPEVDVTVELLKHRLLAAVAPLDRGFAAGPRELARAEAAASALELAMASSPSTSSSSYYSVDGTGGTALATALSGLWRLAFSSSFSGGSLGGSRPGIVGLPAGSLGQVLQRIQPFKKGGARLDNIVEIALGPFRVTLCLGHALALGDHGNASGIATATGNGIGSGGDVARITSDGASLRLRGAPGPLRGLRPLIAPRFDPLGALPEPFREALRPAVEAAGLKLGSATFRTTYVDGDLRVARGDRGELRVFLRA